MVATVNVLVVATDQNNNPVRDARVTAILSIQDVDPTYGYILPETKAAVTDINGHATLALWPNARGSTESYYDFKITNPDNGETLRLTAVLPNTNCNLHDVAGLPPYPGKSETQLATGVATDAATTAVAAKNTAVSAAVTAVAAQADVATNAGIASGAATSAGGAASAASGSASTASGAATAAIAAKTAAETARDAAVAAKTASETAQSGAAGSATTATTQAGTATTQAGIATAQAVIATTKAGEAAGSATVAAGSATAASGSATAAATSAAALSGTSTTSLAIALGTKTFATQAGKQFGAGVPLVAVSASAPTKFMMGTSASYSGGALDIDVTSIGGTGTVADWNILVCGLRGTAGLKGLNWRGAWAGATAYLTDDLVTNAGSTWRRKTDGTSATAPPSDATNWDIAALKGTDGTGAVVTVNTISPVSGDVTLTTVNIAENTNLYFTAGRVLASVLSGLSTATNVAITAADTVLSAFGKLQKQITDHIAALSNVENKSSATIRGELTSSNVTTALTFTPVNPALIGAASGIAQLDGSGKVPAAQLPAYVDDVLEYASVAALPATGASGIIYITIDTTPAAQYRWTGSAYAQMVASPGSTDAVTEGSTNLYFTVARVLASVLAGLSLATGTAVTAADSILVAIGKLQTQITNLTAAKDATGGYAGLTLFKINFKNAANTFTSFFTNTNTAARTYTFRDRNGTIADDTDLAAKASLSGAVFTGANYYAGMQSIAAATTVDLSAATSNYIGITTGTSPITGFTVPAGAKFTLRFSNSGITVNHNSGSCILPGDQNITAASGEVWEIIADAANSIRVISVNGVATATEIQQAISNSKHVTPVGLLGAISVSKYVQTSDQTISSAGVINIAHNIARTPVLMLAYAKCVTAEGNFSAGDIVQISPGAGASGSGVGFVLGADGTNIRIRYGSASQPILLNDNATGAVFAATNSKWNLFIRAWG